MSAKLSVLGVAKILNLSLPNDPDDRDRPKHPGTPCYTPPGALTAKPCKATSKIDVKSDGVLIICPLCERWPFLEA